MRVSDLDRTEARAHALNKARKAAEGGKTGMLLEEDVFIAQLAGRARLLDAEFQEHVLRVVRAHAAEGTASAPSKVGSSAMAGRKASTRACAEVRCRSGGASSEFSVWVHPAPPKGTARMREKLAKYVLPHPMAIWPLSSNILDPVRASLVCDGPEHMLEVLSWFTGGEAETGLRVCRIKNKFAFADAEVSDGYRDLKVCVLFQGCLGLRIIGEIQVRAVTY